MNTPNDIRPPQWLLRILRSIIRGEYLEEIEGDMTEVFFENVETFGVRKARFLFAWDVIMLARPAIVKRLYATHSLTPLYMLSNYLRTGWRNFLKYKSYSAINIIGLCTGFAASLLLFLVVNYERSYDKIHTNSARIYRVAEMFANDDNVLDQIVTPQAPIMDEEYPDIVHSTRFFDSEDILRAGDSYLRSPFHVVDSGFVRMFDFKVLSGDLHHAVSEPGQIAISESVARKLFGDDDPLGQTISLINEDRDLTVAAVVADPPRNSTLQFQVLVPWQSAPDFVKPEQAGDWYNMFMTAYVQLAPGITKEEMERKLSDFPGRHFLPDRKANKIVLLPLEGQHFRQTNSQRIVSILAIIASAILLISCINFVNLTISQLLGRLREIGIRKVMGSARTQLIFQFMTESLIVCSLAVALGLLLTYLVLPIVNDYFGFGITSDFLANGTTVLFVVGICLLVGILSSFWPSLMLSGLKPVTSIRGAVQWNKSGGYLRKGLVVLQFAASVLLVVGTAVIWRQVQYMKSQDLKYKGDHVVSVETWAELFKDPERVSREIMTFKDELAKESAIESVAMSQAVPGAYWHNYNGFVYFDSTEKKTVSLRQITIDDQYFNTYRMKIVEGRNFSRDVESDQKAAIINQTAMRAYGWNDITDKRIQTGGGGDFIEIIGVVEDYYYQSLKEEIQPLIHFFNPELTARLSVRFYPDRVAEGLAILEEKWNALDPYEPFKYQFVDESFDTLYKEQERLGATSSIFAGIALIIAGMGLFSMAAYSIRLRKKEVGIRRVLGASLGSIVVKLSSDFGVLVILGFVIACPVAWYLMNIFLQDFTYRIQLAPWIFLAAGAVVFAISMLMVGLQSRHAAIDNPVNALRDE
jgi:putative ABC transport system permease protein